MPFETLVDLPAHSFVFVDSNVLIYGLSGVSRECEDLLDRCQREELTGVTLYETINEVTHRLMVAEAKSKGVITSGGARALRRSFRLIPTLQDYWNDTVRLLSLNLLFLPVSDSILRAAQTERQAAGLLTNDSLIISCMREYGVSFLATNDSDFERVEGITIFKPTDLP
jgi:predicted nucleic acid-binding protein